MRKRHLPLLVLAALMVTGLAHAQPPAGIARPGNEASIPLLSLGAQLFAGNCASCHGSDGRGISARDPQRGAGDIEGIGPSLRGVGARAADFYLRTGRMPLTRADEEPNRELVQFDGRELHALVAYVASLAPGPPIPTPQPQIGSVPEGLELFTTHCAGCHQVVAEGGIITGARVPPLDKSTPTEIAEAVRIGPYLMPAFSTKTISDSDLNSIIAYVQSAKHPDDRGGWGIGHIGPVPEGLVTWLIAAVAVVAACLVIGKRLGS